MGQIGSKLSFCLKRGFFLENWLMLLLSTYCAPLCYKVSKRFLAYSRSWGIRCCSSGSNWTQIKDLPFKRGFFLKNWLMLILSTSRTLSRYYNVQKKIIKVDHIIQGCIICGQIGLGYLWGKNWLSLLLSICYALSH